MKEAIRAEWTKVRSVSSTAWLLLATLALTVALSAAADAAVKYTPTGARPDITKLSLTGVYLGQALVAILAVLMISGEYSSGTIRVTLAAVPRRSVVLAAKATVLVAIVLPAAAVAMSACLLLGRLVLPTSGFTPAHGYPLLSMADGSTLRAVVGSVLYLVLIALLGLGVATAVRDSAAAIGTVLGLLYVFPIVAALVGDSRWQRHLLQLSPMTAGLAIQDTIDLRGVPIGPWAGLGVLACWAGCALLAGGLVMWVRDA